MPRAAGAEAVRRGHGRPADRRAVHPDRAGRNRRLLSPVSVAAQGPFQLAAGTRRGQPGAVRVAADPASDRQRPRLCRLRWRLHRHRAVLAVPGRRHPPQPLGSDRRSPVPGRHGGDHVRAAHALCVASSALAWAGRL
ncbi:hypothetical protein G6F55_013529 [Rhizopus delemar]|nr:hypothetical protein G6F55_013529 [Rhizopus delemar]